MSKIYVCSFKEKCVTQKATMIEPICYECFIGQCECQNCIDFKNHLASLKSFQAEWVTAEMDGKEVELDKDFRLQYQELRGWVSLGNAHWVDCTEEMYNSRLHLGRRIVAVAIPAKGVKSEEYWRGFDFALLMIDEMYASTHPHDYNIADCVKSKCNRLPKNKIRKNVRP